MTITDKYCRCNGRCAIPHGGTPTDPDHLEICSCSARLSAEDLFSAALTKIESDSIRAWAAGERNRPIWLRLASAYTDKPDGATRLATLILSEAIGL